jgi:uncharacterized membrane protein
LYQLVSYVHLLAAITWVGGTLFLFMVLVPVIRKAQDPPGASVRILSAAARRFRVVAWVALATLVGTGIWILVERGLSAEEIMTGQSRYFDLLRLKMALVVLIIMLSALHDFVLGPRLARALEATRRGPTGQTEGSRARKTVSYLARVSVVLALVVVALGVFLLRGLPF